jgi:mRNA interferase HigB
MRLVSRSRLREFWETSERQDSETPLKTWADVVRKARWASHNDVKAAFGAKVDLAHGRYVFNISGNKYRLICRIDFMKHGVLTRWIGTHAEYDKLCANDGKLLRRL